MASRPKKLSLDGLADEFFELVQHASAAEYLVKIAVALHEVVREQSAWVRSDEPPDISEEVEDEDGGVRPIVDTTIPDDEAVAAAWCMAILHRAHPGETRRLGFINIAQKPAGGEFRGVSEAVISAAVLYSYVAELTEHQRWELAAWIARWRKKFAPLEPGEALSSGTSAARAIANAPKKRAAAKKLARIIAKMRSGEHRSRQKRSATWLTIRQALRSRYGSELDQIGGRAAKHPSYPSTNTMKRWVADFLE